jgi:ribosomal protein L29
MSIEKKTVVELRGHSDKELTQMLSNNRRNIMAQNIASATEKETYKSHLRGLYRRSIAQILTIMRERNKGAL